MQKKKKKKEAWRGNFFALLRVQHTMRSDETAAAAGYLRWALSQTARAATSCMLFSALFEGFQGQPRFLVLLKWKEINYRSPPTNKNSIGAAWRGWIC